MSDTIKQRDFARNICKYLIPGEFIVEGKHKKYSIRIIEIGKSLSDKVTKKTSDNIIVSDKIITSENPSKRSYGCGCVYMDKPLCPKHGRL